MPPKKTEKALEPNDPLAYQMPTEFSGSPEIEKQDITLIIDAKIEGSAGGFNAKLVYMDGHSVSCVAVCKKASRAFEEFELLKSCSHQNIAKPIGVWKDTTKDLGYIVFHHFDGVLSSVSKEVIFEMGEGENSAIDGFSKIGFNILSDVISAVKHVNDHYQTGTTQTENSILPLKPLRIEAGTIFFQWKEVGDYLVLLNDFESVTESNQNDKEKKGKGQEPDVHKIRTRNWNNLGKCIEKLYEGSSANFEVTHLVHSLKKEAVRYDDLVWEAGLWDLSTKQFFIRELFWCYDKNQSRKMDLYRRSALGLQSCMTTLEVMEIKEGTPTVEEKVNMIDSNLFKSVHFLRLFIVAHQSEILEGYSGSKDHLQDSKSAERFVLREKPDYMVRLIEEIRRFKWIVTSPYLRSRHGYMIERHPPRQEKCAG